MNSIIRVLMREIVGKAVLFGYRSDGQLLLLLGSKEVARCEFVGQTLTTTCSAACWSQSWWEKASVCRRW